VFRVSLQADTGAELIVVDWFFVGSLLIDVPLVLLLRRLIAQLSAMQAARLERAASFD
jgi:hypothetical protein